MSGEYPLVSVVVPAYNHEHYIEECLYSILNQNYQRLDLIVINDGSTDNTDQKINRVLKEDPSRFVYISKANEGLIKTLNLGLKLAKGEYFCEIASYYVLLPDSVIKRVDYLQAHPDMDVVFAEAYRMEDDVKTRVLVFGGKEKYTSSQHTIKDLIEGKAKILFSSGMFRRTLLEQLGGFDEDFRYGEDVAMWYQLAIHARIAYLGEPVLYHRKHPGNTSSSVPFKTAQRKEKILALEKIFPFLPEDSIRIFNKYLYREYIKFLKFASANPADNIDHKLLNDVLRKSFELRPCSLKVRYYKTVLKAKGYFNTGEARTI
jgi:alpha-1,3-rhamnosyltransferase